MQNIYPILLAHVWNGLLNGWIRPERDAVTAEARSINMPGLENMRILPVLVKTVHMDEVDVTVDESGKNHMYFRELFTGHVLLHENAGAAMDRFEQKWALILYQDQYPVTPEELRQRCAETARLAQQESWQLRFYIGRSCLPEELYSQWEELSGLSGADADWSAGVVQAPAQKPGQPAEIPKMDVWRAMLRQGKFAEVEKQISELLETLAGSGQVDGQWLSRFRSAFLLEIYQTIQEHGIPADLVFTGRLAGDDFARSVSGVRLMQSWVSRVLGRISAFLESESADTVVKKACKYILQNLDQPLTREEIASRVFISSGYLGRVFKKEVNMSLTEYIFTERMKLAAKMLEQTDLHVSSIALSVGFSNFPYFSTRFRKFSGLTPVEYRRRHREQAEP